MKIGLSNYYLEKYGLDTGAKRMASHGYSAVDYNFADTESIFYSEKEEKFMSMLYEIKNKLKTNGLFVNQIHGPWSWPVNDSTEDDRAERFGKMAKALVIAKHLGAKYMAIHPLMPFGNDSMEKSEEVYNINVKYYSALANVAKNLGVIICLENLPFEKFPISSTEDVIKLIDIINHPNVKMCFDTGHAHILGESLGDSIRLIGRDRLKILHVHDNPGHDAHLPPYEGTIDWSDVAEGLFDIGYDGIFSLETSPIISNDSELEIGERELEEKELELARIAQLIAG